ncbi:MerR family transcriptional regulator [Curtobacterium ammoniigenes]|uniref:MerR family transcriptional regulator n=1 Tax=Curtobacterium ammoniigenes TaxID=395387 RepID=UPI00082E0CEC|nr:MerR family transcriptional regulator [Curtobacterium ammoniigenes]
MDDAEPMMHIGAAAERTGLSHRTLRHYEEVGLVTPSGRTGGGFRLYTEGDIDRLLLVRRMKPLGYSIDEMKHLLAVVDMLRGSPEDTEARTALATLVQEARERRIRLARQLEMADEFSAMLEAL